MDSEEEPSPVRRKRVATAPLIGALVVIGLVVVGAWSVARGPHESTAIRQRVPLTGKVTAQPVVLRSTPTPSSTPDASPTRKTLKPVSRTPTVAPRPTGKPPQPTHPPTLPTPPTPPPPPPPPPPPTTGPPTPSGPAEAREILQLTNTERAKAGCGPLQLNGALNRAAQGHANDMVENHYFAHNSEDGRTPADRMRAAGFAGGSTAENLATGSRDPAAVVNAWMNSDTDRSNLLNCSFTMLGVGYDSGRIKSKWGHGTWVQDLGR
ncbi:CAP domain-containing protein [Kribbella sp. NPDC058245]|uniref:CAP domain-containing protein n=1 Tax=Kribbella sp. NPDC058245 TaxID=3346399 RepID=UPI0036E79EE1